MEHWLRDAIDQIALGEILANSELSCGERFGLIAVDNSIEFMLISYIEVYKQLVGGHKSGGIPKKDWEETKRYFSDLLSLVISKESNLQILEDEINRNHDLRNDLYHTGKPRTVSSAKVLQYSKIAKEALSILFSISYDQAEWDELVENTLNSLENSKTPKLPRRTVEYEVIGDHIRFITKADTSAKDAISLILHGYPINHGDYPDRDQVLKSLILSGKTMTRKVFNTRLAELRRETRVRKNNLSLTAKGKKQIEKSFIIP